MLLRAASISKCLLVGLLNELYIVNPHVPCGVLVQNTPSSNCLPDPDPSPNPNIPFVTRLITFRIAISASIARGLLLVVTAWYVCPSHPRLCLTTSLYDIDSNERTPLVLFGETSLAVRALRIITITTNDLVEHQRRSQNSVAQVPNQHVHTSETSDAPMHTSLVATTPRSFSQQ